MPRSGQDLFLDELGEEALGLNSRDIAPVITPHQNATFDVEKEECRGGPRHWFRDFLEELRDQIDEIWSISRIEWVKSMNSRAGQAIELAVYEVGALRMLMKDL